MEKKEKEEVRDFRETRHLSQRWLYKTEFFGLYYVESYGAYVVAFFFLVAWLGWLDRPERVVTSFFSLPT